MDLPPLATGPTDAAGDPFARFMVYDDDASLVYEDAEDRWQTTSNELSFDPSKVTVPRYLLYMQGILLGVVALACFLLGIVTGGSAARVGEIHEPMPSVISGRIALRTQSDDTLADPGAVAMVFPQEMRPESRFELVGLRSRDPEPTDDHPTLRAIRSLGGDYARADQNGVFRLRVPDRGKYYVLVISATRRRTADDEIPRQIRAELGRFFQFEPEMFSGYDFRWQPETVRGDRQLSFLF